MIFDVCNDDRINELFEIADGNASS